MARSADDRREALLLGLRAEARVAEALEEQGWRVLARNWRFQGGELDIVVAREGRLRVVEVKARAPDDPVGLEVIDARKRRHLVRAAEAFLSSYEDVVDEVCFLVALVEGERITWLDHAFDA